MNAVFDAYAHYYDLTYAGKDYASEAEYVTSLLGGVNGLRILELGCGTGGHAAHLARAGAVVHGIDFSDAMLARAATRKSAMPFGVAERFSFVQGDVRTYRDGAIYDAALSLFHVISYQTDDAELTAAFETAATHLAPGGLFVFDYWYGPGVLAQRPESRTRVLEDDTVRARRCAEPTMFLDRHVVRVDYEIDVERKTDGVTRSVHERHEMRYLFLPEVEAIASPWFEPVAHYGWMTQRVPGAEDWAAVSVMRRCA